MTLPNKRVLRRGRPVPKSQHQPELNNSDDGAPGASSETDQPTKTQPARRSQRATKTASARQTAMQTQQPGSSAGPSSLLDLSASEAAAGLPPIHRPRTRSEHRDSKQHVKASSADAEAAASGSARHPPARRRTRQNASEDGNAGPLQPDADDITVHGSLRQSASAAPKRRRSAAEADGSSSAIKKAKKDPLLMSQEDPMDLDSPQRGRNTLRDAPGEPEEAPHGMFSCAICLDEHSMQDCYTASMCGHRMCRKAARKVVLGAVRSWSFPVLCPICQAKSEPRCIACSKRKAALPVSQEAGQAEDVLSGPNAWCCTLDADVPQLLTAKEEKRYLHCSLKAAARSRGDLVTCPRPKCEGMAVTTQGKESPALKCNVCEHEWCGKCNVKWHSNKSCDEYQRETGEKKVEQSLKTYRKGHRIINCPTCKHGIERSAGCNHMMCSVCKTPFCWLCGVKTQAHHDWHHRCAL